MAPAERTPDGRHIVVGGRRWRAEDPELPDDVLAALRTHLGRARSAVRLGTRGGDHTAVAAARRRVQLAKEGLGERGEAWWDLRVEDRVRRARDSLDALEDGTGS